jgi:hypothetical protein
MDHTQNRKILKNRYMSQAVCKVEGCSEKATYGERSEVHGCMEYERCKGHKDNFTHFTRCKWTFDFLLKTVTFVGAVMTSPEAVKSWVFDEVNQKKKISLTCPVHDRQYDQALSGLTIGKHGCTECTGNVPWSERVPELLDFITGRRYTLDEPLEDLKRGLEKEGSFYKLKLICPNGHKYYSGTVVKFTAGMRGCPACTDPKTEKLVREWLEKEFINKFENRAHPDFLFYPETGRKLELDLFCAKQKLAFEIDGKQHNEYCPKHFHRIQEKENNTFDNTNPWHRHQIYPGEPQNDRLFIHQQKKDRFKDKSCEEEGIYLIRIDRRYYNHRDPGKLIVHLEEQIKKVFDRFEWSSK